ncbi:MAG: undecaprenyl/decaprenyl-phosphate alpha-N-acetylglucosaminyl 1-phosphate transferase [Oscillospiraceae bacterium]|nr:undecaprenyl/decaprenyl-phosphate alpha-N-acetylglucosaminyl 1-phosphate transferase [Oscillospiraceae bacterium]
MDNIVNVSLGSINLYDLLTGIIAVIFAALMAFVTTPISRVIAYKIGAIDVPKDNRRMHKEPIPRLGGLAIFFSFVFSVLLFYKVSNTTLAMIAGAFLLVIVGILDDVFRLRPLYKFFVQVAAAGIVVWQGLVINHINIFGQYIEFGYLAIPITMIWIIGLTNAINLIDGLDGLACGISTISAVALLVVTILIGEFEVALLIGILAGSCLGFLPFNTSPANIIMGDTGSTFLGFILAIVSIQGVFKVHAVITFVIPFLILGVPIFDTLFAMLRRILTGRHPFSADRGHLHHRLIDMGFNHKQTVRILYAVSALLGVSSIMLVTQRIVYAVIIIAVSLGISVVTWIIFKDEKMRIESGLIPDKSEHPEISDKTGASETPEKSENSENSEKIEYSEKEDKTNNLNKSNSEFKRKRRQNDK